MNLLERINRVINDPLFEEVLESRGLTLETFREDIRVWSLHPTVETTFRDLPEAYRTAIASCEVVRDRSGLLQALADHDKGMSYRESMDEQGRKQLAAEVDLELLDDQQLDEIFSWEVAREGGYRTYDPGQRFVSDFNLILRYLNVWHATIERVGEWRLPWQVLVEDDDHCWMGRALTPARAAVIALIKANRKEPNG